MRVLHVLSQRPSLTGSGITLDAMVRHAAASGWEQRAVVGVPAADPSPPVGGLDPRCIHPLVFDSPPLDFLLPGMSDVMPYPSSRFSSLSQDQVARYKRAWIDHLRPLLANFDPHIIHSHHLWILSSLLKEVAPDTPVISHCHATGFRQMELCPDLADEVRSGCSQNDRFAVLHRGHRNQLIERLGVEPDRVHVVGAGYREDLFHARGVNPDRPPALLYAGKFSDAKGVPQLLNAFEGLRSRHSELELHIVGDGAGDEAEKIRARMEHMAPAVVCHGRLAQADLADVARRATVFVLPSFYEGLPLVLVEALACGCRLVATDLPGVTEELAPRIGPALATVSLPRLETVDRPFSDDVPAFTTYLEAALEEALSQPPIQDPEELIPGALSSFTWSEVFARVERAWRDLIASG